MRHEWPIRIYYEDTDAGGVVYHGQYLKFADRARTEFLRSCGISLSDADADLSVIFLVRRLEISYMRPMLLDELISVFTHQISITAARSRLQQSFERGGKICAVMEVELVCVSRETMRPVAFPEFVRWALNTYSVSESTRDARSVSS